MARANITIYLVGNDESEALEGLIWEDADDASKYALDNGYLFVYEVEKTIEASDLHLAIAFEEDESV